jgi:hypothetical protein
LTDFDVTTFQKEDGSYVLAGKGTTEGREWFRDNSQIFFSLHDHRVDYGDVNDPADVFNKMVYKYRDLRKQVGNEPRVHFTGFSRGGSMALAASRRVGESATVFNPGAGVFSFARGLACQIPFLCDEKERNILSVEGDTASKLISSNLNKNERHTVIRGRKDVSMSHDILHFLPETRRNLNEPVIDPYTPSREFCQLYPDYCRGGKIQTSMAEGGGGGAP